MVWHSYHRAWIEEKQFQKKHFQAQDSTSCFDEKPCKAICLGCKGHSQARRLSKKDSRYIITYIGVKVRDVSRKLAHESKAGEVAMLALDLLILL
jgi:hypothetical protein